MFRLGLLFFVLLFSSIRIVHADVGQKYYEQIYSSTIFLTNSEAITFGFANFDPDSFNPNVDSDPDSDPDDPIKLRNQLKVFNLPYNLALPSTSDEYEDELNFSLSFVEQAQEQDFGGEVEGDAPDYNKDSVYTAYAAFSRNWKLSNHWTFRSRLGGYIMHHRNEHDYNSAFSQYVKDEVEGQFFNAKSNAAIIEPNIRFTYDKPTDWGKWSFSSDYNYFYGWAFSGPSISRGANPEGWEIANTLKYHYRLYQGLAHAESLFVKAQRVDIGGDIKPSLGTHYYYEFGLGLLLNTSKMTTLLDNVGIGLNLNVGSSLNGGSVVFYFNEI